MPDKFIPLEDVQAEAARLKVMLDAGEFKTSEFADMAYAAYEALLFVLDYGTQPPSQAYSK